MSIEDIREELTRLHSLLVDEVKNNEAMTNKYRVLVEKFETVKSELEELRNKIAEKRD